MALAQATHYHALTLDTGTLTARVRSANESPSTIN
jgi:hypothetical protein